MANVFLGCPRYTLSETDRSEAAHADIRRQASASHRLTVCLLGSSLLAHGCNTLLQMALNGRDKNEWEWFAMIHGDVFPQAGWLDALIDEAGKVGADFLSAVVPLKNESGKTSTALAVSYDPSLNRECPRLTQRQLHHESFPRTFDVMACADALERLPEPYRMSAPRVALLCNTGCFIVRIDRDWDWTKVCFSMVDGLEVIEGQYRAKLFSEDWMFSLRVAQAGGAVFATSKINLAHRGNRDYRSNEQWGDPRDTGYGIYKTA